MKKTATAPNEIFNEAMDWFFGHNPVNPYWFLLVLYLRKKHLLSIENNYPGDSINTLTPINEPGYWEIDDYKFPDGVYWQSVVGQIEGNERLISIKNEFERACKGREEARHRTPRNLSEVYQWEDAFLLETTSMLLKIDDEWFDNNFNVCFNKALRRIYAKERFELFTQPEELTDLVGKLMGKDIKTVYDPFAGVASFSLLIPHTAQYVGEEIVPIIAAIANLRILANNVNGEVLIADSINALGYDADIIVSNPPMRLRIHNPQIEKLYGGANDADTLLLRKCAVNGLRGIIVVPSGISYWRDYCRNMRELLIERDCVDMIIELPPNILEGTSIATSLYVLNPKHNHKGKIRIIDATDCICGAIESKLNVKLKLNVNEIASLIDGENKKSILVDCKTIADNDYSFEFNRYTLPEVDLPEGSKLMTLSELGTIQMERTPRNVTTGRFANFSQLVNPNKLKIYTPLDFELRALPPSTIKVSHDCIIVSGARGLRASYLQTKGETLYVPAGYYCFLPNESVVLPQYLVLQLRSDFVQKQIGDRSLTLFHQDKFNYLKVIIPSIEEQRRAIDEYQTSLIIDLGVKFDELKTQRFNEYERNMRLRKHALNQILNEIVPATRLIANFVSSQDGAFTKDNIVVKRSNSSLETYIHKLLRNVVKVQDLISTLTDVEKFAEPEIIDMKSFFSEYEQTKLTSRYDFKTYGYKCFLCNSNDPNEILAADESQPNLTAYISRKSLITILDNIIANADKHGFTDEQRQDYAIRINYANVLIDGTDMLEICVLNNGNKLPKGMTPDKVFSWGVGSGTGLGSWQTKNIVEHYGGYIEFNQFDDNADGFNIEYRIILPMTD